MARHAAIPRVAGALQREAGVDDGAHFAGAHELHHGEQILAVVGHVEILEAVGDGAEGSPDEGAERGEEAGHGGREVHHCGAPVQVRGEGLGRDEVRAVEHDVVLSAGRARVRCALRVAVVQHLVRPKGVQKLHVARAARDRGVRAG